MKQVPISREQDGATEALRGRFCALWQRLAGGGADRVWRQLHCRYAEPHRRYHNLDHIAYSLTQLDRVSPLADEADVIELAIWFHDVIYEINRSDNEARSAELLRDLANGKLDAGLIERVEELILATTHKAATDDVSCQYMLDIDLAGFGRPWAEFVANSVAIREEQQSSPTQEIAFLDMLDARQRIFQSDYFFQRLEPRARSNIARYRADCVSRNAGTG